MDEGHDGGWMDEGRDGGWMIDGWMDGRVRMNRRVYGGINE